MTLATTQASSAQRSKQLAASGPFTTGGLFRSRYVAQAFYGADEALAALEAIQSGLVSTAFQTLDWVSCLYEELARARYAEPRLIVVRERTTGALVCALPLVIVRNARLRIAHFADLGVSDYGAPILAAAIPSGLRARRAVWRAVRAALPGVDLMMLERMPTTIAGVANPFVGLRGTVPARQSGFQLSLGTGSVDDYVAAQGKKFRKEAQRCERVWQREGGAVFYRATSPEQLARVYSTLEEQQATRHAELDTRYVLHRPAFRAFYERVSFDGSDTGLSRLYALESDGEIAATLFGVVHDETFTMLRITFGGDRFTHFSPGRLIILQAMRDLAQQGVSTFDFGIGEYEYKRRMGAEPTPLTDLIVAISPRAMLHAAALRLTRRARRIPWLRATRDRLAAGVAKSGQK